MCRKWFKNIFMLCMLLISIVSTSMAACPVARNELYTTQCGATFSVPAPGILANDNKDVGKTLNVVNPESITISPTLGTLKVNANGSFVYKASQNIKQGTYVSFRYKVTDGICVSTFEGTAKIQVSCTCHGAAPDLTFYGVTTVAAADLIAKGAGCMGCQDATPKFGLSQIGTEIGVAYPYNVKCPSVLEVTGHVTFLYDCTQLVCDDGNVCTDDSCNPASGCANNANTASCNDENACTTGDICANKACTPGVAVSCEDNNVCTDDSCNPATGCVNAANTASCNDENACTTGDVCANKACTSGVAVSCADSNVCTDDSCNPASGCANTANTVSCDDGNACTDEDVCADKVCTSGVAVSCDDSNVCTDDSCNPASGCVNTANTACDEGNACNGVPLEPGAICCGEIAIPPEYVAEGAYCCGETPLPPFIPCCNGVPGFCSTDCSVEPDGTVCPDIIDSDGAVCCAGGCVDSKNDELNCGGCGATCEDGNSCCNGGCVDLQTDGDNCGYCGGSCWGLSCCGGGCVNTDWDFHNCGACGTDCANTPGATECCMGECFDYQTDPNHCGSCWNTCDAGEICASGKCVLDCETTSFQCGDACCTDTNYCAYDRDTGHDNVCCPPERYMGDGLEYCCGEGTCAKNYPGAIDWTCIALDSTGSCPTCEDGIQNEGEINVDCGGAFCEPCCNDNIKNGDETDVDCGGSCANDCSMGQSCRLNDIPNDANCEAGTFCESGSGGDFGCTVNCPCPDGYVCYDPNDPNDATTFCGKSCDATHPCTGGATCIGDRICIYIN